jgi:hypothetical protein
MVKSSREFARWGLGALAVVLAALSAGARRIGA